MRKKSKFLTISLSPDLDADILDFFAAGNFRNRSEAVREILHDYMRHQEAHEAVEEAKNEA